MISMYKFNEIRRLADEGLTRSAIATKLKINRKTVSRYLANNGPPNYSPRQVPTRKDLFGPFSADAMAIVELGGEDLTGAELFLRLREKGYRGSERTIERRLAKIRGNKPKERFFEQVYEPGEQAQFDFKEEVPILFKGGMQIVQLHFGTLPCSDAVFIKAFPFKNFEAFIEGVHSFFEHINGQTTNIRIDNLSPCVSKVLRGSNRVYTAAFERAIAYYGFKVLPCQPAKGNQKGDVERDIRTYARRIRLSARISGRVFVDFDDLNQWLLEVVERYRSDAAKERLDNERKSLRPLPSRADEVLCKVDLKTISSHGTVRIGSSTYSVPDEAIGRSCRILLSGYDVIVREIGGLAGIIAKHPRKIDGKNSILPEHILPSLIRKPAAMIRWAHREILFPLPGFNDFYKILKSIEGINPEREFLRAVNLVQHASMQDIGAGMEIVSEEHSEDPLGDLKRLLGIEGQAKSSIETVCNSQPAINSGLALYDDLIPNLKEVS